jgi:hypothetical protein
MGLGRSEDAVGVDAAGDTPTVVDTEAFSKPPLVGAISKRPGPRSGERFKTSRAALPATPEECNRMSIVS